MMRSLYAGISGLKNHQTRMDVIGNNIANVNTVGFKSSRVTFQDMLSQTIQGAAGAAAGKGGTNPMQIGLGMGLASIDTVFTDGSFQPTGKQTDLAIGGQGFFVLSDGLNQVYTRAGAFDFDTVGNFLVPGTGYKVMGWKADSTGKIDPAQPIAGIQIPVGGSMPAKVTNKLTYVNNLSAGAKAMGTTAEIAAAATALALANTAVTATAADLVLSTAAAATPAEKTAATAIVTASNYSTKATADKGTAVAASALVPTDAALITTATTGAAYTALSATAKTAVDAAHALAYDPTNPVLIANANTATAALAAGDAALIATYNADYNALSSTAKAVVDATAAETATAANLLLVKGLPASTLNVTKLADDTIAATKAVADQVKAAADVKLLNNKTSDVQTSINVYDSQGNTYKLNGTFEKIADNQWSFTPASTIVDSTGAVLGKVQSSAPIVLDFNADGTFKQSTAAATIKIDPTGLTPPSPYSGAGAFILTPEFSTMTQFGGESSAQATIQDGYTAGTLSKVTIDPTGTVVGRFTNGQSLNLAQVALAVFNNPAGLNKSGENLFIESNNSGTAQIGQSDTGGRGKFSPGSLEMSNVDLASEFSNMIVTQRGFQANSKIITTTDTMLEELVNLKR